MYFGSFLFLLWWWLLDGAKCADWSLLVPSSLLPCLLKSLLPNIPHRTCLTVLANLLYFTNCDCRIMMIPCSKSLQIISRQFSKYPQKFAKKPVILLDVDGVINCNVMGCGHTRHWRDTVEEVHAGPCNVSFSPTVVAAINRWSKTAEIRWLTAWNSRAITHLAPALGLNAFRLAEGRESDTSKCKLEKIESAIATAKEVGADGLVVWIDDDLRHWKKGWMKHKLHPVMFSRPNTVLLSPTPAGLFKDDLEFMDKILEHPELSAGKVIEKFGDMSLLN